MVLETVIRIVNYGIYETEKSFYFRFYIPNRMAKWIGRILAEYSGVPWKENSYRQYDDIVLQTYRIKEKNI